MDALAAKRLIARARVPVWSATGWSWSSLSGGAPRFRSMGTKLALLLGAGPLAMADPDSGSAGKIR